MRKLDISRYEITARKIGSDFGVRCEWSPASRGYVVEHRPFGDALAARKYARECAKEFAAQAGAGNSYRPKLYLKN